MNMNETLDDIGINLGFPRWGNETNEQYMWRLSSCSQFVGDSPADIHKYILGVPGVKHVIVDDHPPHHVHITVHGGDSALIAWMLKTYLPIYINTIGNHDEMIEGRPISFSRPSTWRKFVWLLKDKFAK